MKKRTGKGGTVGRGHGQTPNAETQGMQEWIEGDGISIVGEGTNLGNRAACKEKSQWVQKFRKSITKSLYAEKKEPR